MSSKANPKKWIKYLKYEIWRIPIHQLPKWRALLIRFLRVIILAFRGFVEDRIQIRASALTFYTLLSILPFIAIAFGVAQGFGFKENLILMIKDNLAGQEEVAEWLISIAESLLENSKTGFMTGIALFVLIVAVMKVMNDIENMFNHIWQIQKSRTLIRKFTDYFSLIIIAPTLIILSASASVYIVAQVKELIWSSSFLNYINPFITFLLKLIPYLLIWFLLSLFYAIMPNTRVRFNSAIIAGIFAGTLFQLTQYLFIELQLGLSRVSALYGGFAVFPLILIWIHVSWIIVLFGAELSYSNQNASYHEFEYDLKNISPSFRKLIALLIMNKIVKQFENGKPPFQASDISTILEVPIRMVRELLNDLVTCNLLIEAEMKETKEATYLPASGTNRITINHVLQQMEDHGSQQITIRKDHEFKELQRNLMAMRRMVNESDHNKPLAEI